MTVTDGLNGYGADLVARMRGQGSDSPSEQAAPGVSSGLSFGADLVARMRTQDRPQQFNFSDIYDLLGDAEFNEANRAVEEDRGFFSSALRGIGSTFGGENTPFGIGSARVAQNIARFLYLDNKLRRGEASRDQQLEHLEKFTEYSRQPGVREMAGDIVGALPSFGAEIATGVGLGTLAIKGGTRGARVAAARLARDAAAESAQRAMARRITGAAKAVAGSAVAKGVAGAAAGTAMVEAVPNMLGMGGGRWTSYALQKAMPQLQDMDPEDWDALEGLSNAALVDMLAEPLPLWQGALDSAIEFGSEFAGAGIGKALNATVAGAYVLTLQKRVFDKIAGRVGNRGADLLDDLARRTRYDGPIVEMLEERLGDAARVATGLEDVDQLMPEMDELAAEALALSFPALGGAAVRRALKLSRGEMSANEKDFGGAEVMEPDAEIEASAMQRLERAGVKNPRVFRPEAGSEENLAERWASMTGRRLLVVEADSFDTPAGTMGGVTFAPDLIVASRAEARPWRLAAHELRHTVQQVSTRSELAAQRAAIDAVDPGLIPRAFKDWQGAVAEGGAETKAAAAPEGLESFEGEATLSEWVAPLMAYAARNADGRRAVERLAAEDTTGFWAKVWAALKRLAGAFTRDGRADLGARIAASHVPAVAQLTPQQAAEVALLLEDWVQGSEARVARWAGSPTAKATRDGSGAAGTGLSTPAPTTPGADSAADSSQQRVGGAASASPAEAQSVPRGTAEDKPAGTKEEREAEKASRELARKMAAVPLPGDVVQVNSVGNQGLADVLETIGDGPEVRLRVRLRADHQGEPGGRARTGNRKNRTIEVHRSEVRMYEKRAAEGERGVRRKVAEERDAITKRLVESAKRPVTLADPVSVWGKSARKGKKASAARSVAPEPELDADVEDEVDEADVAQPGAPKLTAAERRAARTKEAPPVTEPAESTDPELGHQTDPPALKPAEEALAQKIAQKLLSVLKLQTRYMGNKAKYLRAEAWNLARLLATAQDAETVFDWYAGGGSYALSVVASGALPNAKRIVVNEFDPVRRARLEAALSEGGAFMDEWTSNPFLVELRGHLDKLRGKRSASVFGPALDALAMPERKGAEAHGWFKKASSQYAQLTPRAKAAIIAFADMADGHYRADTESLLEMAREDATRVQQLAAAVRARGIAIETVSLDAVSEEAVAMVQAAGKGQVVFADPPYHKTSTGTYSRGDGSTLKMNSDEALAMYVHGVARMAIGNAAVYHNNATPEARDTVYHALGGFVHLRTWERIKETKSATAQWEVVGYAYGQKFDGQSRARAGGEAGFPLADAAGGAGGAAVLGRAGAGQPGDADAAAARGAGGSGDVSGRGALEPWFEPVGTIDWMVDALAGAGQRRGAVEGVLAARSVQAEAMDSWDPFGRWDLPLKPGAGARADQSLNERLAARSAAQRKAKPITLVDHILALGGIDLRGVGRKNEGGTFEDVILGATGSRAGIPAGLLKRSDSMFAESGLSPDNLRESLKEQGFVGQESDGRMSFDDIADAIGNELGGGVPMLAPGNEGLMYAEDARLQAARETTDLLGLTGADLEQVGQQSEGDAWTPFAPGRPRKGQSERQLDDVALETQRIVDAADAPRRRMGQAGSMAARALAGDLDRKFHLSTVIGRIANHWNGFLPLVQGFDGFDVMEPAAYRAAHAAWKESAADLVRALPFMPGVDAKTEESVDPVSELRDALPGGRGLEPARALLNMRNIERAALGRVREPQSDETRERSLARLLDYGSERDYANAAELLRDAYSISDPALERVIGGHGGPTDIRFAPSRPISGAQLDEFLRFAPANRTRIRSRDEIRERFAVGANTYEVVLSLTDDPGSIEFDADVIDIAFGRLEKNKPLRLNYSDLGDEPKPATVFATVLAAMRDGVRELAQRVGMRDVVVYFTAATEQRARLYERLAMRAVADLGGAVEEHDNETGQFEIVVRIPGASGERFAPGWHGSPHKFDKFELAKIGSGEGASPGESRDGLLGNGVRGARPRSDVPATADERLADDTRRSVEELSELLVANAGVVQPSSEINVVRRDRMLGVMRGLLENDQVRVAVVRLVPIDVVNMLSGRELTAEALLNDPSVLVDLTAVSADDAVPGRAQAVDELARLVASAGAEFAANLDGGAALVAGVGHDSSVAQPEPYNERFAPSRMAQTSSRVYRTLRGMLVSDVQDVELVQAEIDERVGITAATDFVGAIDLARSRGPANVQGLIHRIVAAVGALRGRTTMDDLNRLVYAKTAPMRNAWLKVALADRYLRQRLEIIEGRLKRYGKILSPQQLGRLQGEVNAIGKVRVGADAERLTYARRRGVKISDAESGLDDLTAAAEVARLRRSIGPAQADQLLDFIRDENWKALERAVASGILTPELAKKWHGREPYYVSLKDVDETLDEAAGYARPGRSMSVRGPLWRAAEGRETEAQRSLEAWLEDKLRCYEHIARNEALQVGAAMARSDPKAGLTVLQRNPRGDEVERAVPFYEGGRQAFLVFPTPAAAQALKGLHGQQVGEILGMIGIGTRFFSRMVTSRNPAFWLPNFLRDTAQAMWTITAERGLVEGFEVLAGAWKVLPQVVMHSLGKKTALSPIIDQAILDGIKTTWVGPHTLKERLQEMHDALSPQAGVGVFVRNGLRTFDAISDAFEVATRISMYQHDLARGKTRREAALNAKNITVNFDKKGTLTPSLSALYSFFNPAVQGARRIIEAATETQRGIQVAAATVTMGLLWEMLAYALSDDDDETGLSVYGQLASWSKDRNLHMPFAVGGVYATYPMPYGVSSIFGFGRYMAHLLFDDMDPRVTRATAVQSAFWNVVNEFQPMGDVRNPYVALTPTVIKPLTELKENRKFGGRPIMRDKVQFGEELPDSARAFSSINDRASGWLGQKIANVLNAGGPEDLETGLDVSPATVQHLIQWIGSGFGLREIDRLSQFAMSSREVPGLANTPFLRNFTNSVSSHATSESYYDLRDRADRVWRRAKDARGAPRERALAQDPDLYHMAPAFDSTDRQLRVLQQRMDGASREQAHELQERRLELQARLVRAYYGRQK